MTSPDAKNRGVTTRLNDMSSVPSKVLDQTDDRDGLAKEVNHLHQSLFGRPPTASVIEHYIQAHMIMPELHDVHDAEVRTVRAVIEKKLDAIAVEPWLRDKNRHHLLSRKIFLLSYISECDAEHVEYNNHIENRFIYFGVMLFECARASFTMAKGLYLKVRHGLF
ncbi:hypothetical protein [Rhizobium sp. RU36D]|uniref:hypothetical protein n=1 Tax=Rhizobium sp. RU36D TaxID=1907415 RepID=UPI00117B8AF1|nr:hypothetical protein [Rhizobium sp. RU36D]